VTGEADGPGTYAVDLEVSDGTATDTVSFDITVAELNVAPVADPIADQFPNEGDTVAVTATASDVDLPANTLTWTLVAGPGSVDTGGNYRWLPTETDGPGTYPVTLYVTDGAAAALVSFDVVIGTAINQPPIAVDDTLNLDAGSTATIAPLRNDDDPDGDELLITGLSDPPRGSVQLADGIVTYGAPLGFSGDVTITYSITDGRGGEASATITFVVLAVNQSPTGGEDQVDLTDYRSITIDVLANDADPDGDLLRVLSVMAETEGDVVLNADGTITYTPVPGWVGTDVFTYIVEDPEGARDTVTVVITITASVRDDATALSDALGTRSLPFPSPRALKVGSSISIPSLSTEVSLLAAAFYQTLGALSLPLVFLGLALAVALTFGGFSEVPILLASRRRRLWSVVLMDRENVLQARVQPEIGAQTVYQYEPTARGIKSLDRPRLHDGERLIAVETPNGPGWVSANALTETVDLDDFIGDDRPVKLVRRLLALLEAGRDITPVIAPRGLTVALTSAPHFIPRERLTGLMRGQPAGASDGVPEVETRFRELVAEPLRSALLDNAQIDPKTKHSSSALIPVELWNFPYLAIRAPGHASWVIYFEYVNGNPAIVGFGVED
jgi:hypothetical protein